MVRQVVLLISVICFAALFEQVVSECCRHNGKFECCGHGRCNIFCCNCDETPHGVCRDQKSCDFDPTIAATAGGLAGGVLLEDESVTPPAVNPTSTLTTSSFRSTWMATAWSTWQRLLTTSIRRSLICNKMVDSTPWTSTEMDSFKWMNSIRASNSYSELF